MFREGRASSLLWPRPKLHFLSIGNRATTKAFLLLFKNKTHVIANPERTSSATDRINEPVKNLVAFVEAGHQQIPATPDARDHHILVAVIVLQLSLNDLNHLITVFLEHRHADLTIWAWGPN